jgi:hypothetical protein
MLMYILMAPYAISLISGVRLRLAISVTQEYKVLFFTFSTQQPDLCQVPGRPDCVKCATNALSVGATSELIYHVVTASFSLNISSCSELHHDSLVQCFLCWAGEICLLRDWKSFD